MKILVLGSEGIIGNGLCKKLKTLGHEVSGWDILLGPEQDLRISAPDMSSFDFVFFLAYDIGGSKYLINKTTSFINNNMKIMINTFDELEKSGTPFIFASSQMQNMDHPYGTLKRIGENYTTILGGLSIRFWNVYDYEEVSVKSHVIPDFIKQFINTGRIKLLTDGVVSSPIKISLYSDLLNHTLLGSWIFLPSTFEKDRYTFLLPQPIYNFSFNKGSADFIVELEDVDNSTSVDDHVSGVIILGEKVDLHLYHIVQKNGNKFTALRNDFIEEIERKNIPEWKQFLSKLSYE